MKPILDIRRADDTSALFDFQCGVKSMDDFIHDQANGLAKFIKLRLSKLWIVYENEKAVAFFALSKDALMLNSDDWRTIEHDKEKSAALGLDLSGAINIFLRQIEIDYLAVCKEKREEPSEHLGTAILQKIAQFAAADKLSATMFLTVEALDTKEYSAVEFYRNCDFEFSEVAQNKYNYEVMFGNRPTTRRMYKLIIPID